MIQGLDPRYVRYPDIYRIYDFHQGPAPASKKLCAPLFLTHAGVSMTPHSSFKDHEEEEEGEEEEDPNAALKNDLDYICLQVEEDTIVLKRADLYIPNADNWTSLHACCHSRHTIEAGMTLATLLVEQHQEFVFDIPTHRGPGNFTTGWTPLHLAVAYNLGPLVEHLLRLGASPRTLNSVQWSPVHEVAHRGFCDIFRLLYRYCPSILQDATMAPSFPLCPFPAQFPLAEAARQGHVEMTTLLLESGAKKDQPNDLGWTALHEAAYQNRRACVEVLLVYGADANVKTLRGQVARDLTISSEIQDILGEVTAEDKLESTTVAEDKQESTTEDKHESRDAAPEEQAITSQKISKPKSFKESKAECSLLGELPSLNNNTKLTTTASMVKKPKHKGKDKQEVVRAPAAVESSNTDIPAEFQCQISHKLMTEPVVTPYGHVRITNFVNYRSLVS